MFEYCGKYLHMIFNLLWKIRRFIYKCYVTLIFKFNKRRFTAVYTQSEFVFFWGVSAINVYKNINRQLIHILDRSNRRQGVLATIL